MHKIIFLSILIMFFSCCGDKNKHIFKTNAEKDFYTDYGGMDYSRFPLIFPYEVMNADFVEKKWIINLKIGYEFYNSIYKVKDIAVSNNIIFAHSTTINPVIEGRAPLQWFVIIPSKKIEIGFSTEMELLDYVKIFGISKISWKDVNDVSEEFKSSECLPWIPGCSK